MDKIKLIALKMRYNAARVFSGSLKQHLSNNKL